MATNEKAAPPPAAARGDVPYDRELVADALRQFADALTSGELEGAGRYLPSSLIEQADMLIAADNASASAETVSRKPEARGVVDDEDGMPVGFAGWYNRTFRTRGADTKHLNDCEEAWRAALTGERNG